MIDASGPDTETLAEHQLPNYQPATEQDHLQDRSESELKLIRKKLQEGWFSKITPEQEAAINDYISDPAINAQLRTKPDLSTLTAEELRQFKCVEEAIILAGRRESETMIWRGIAPENSRSILKNIETALVRHQRFREYGIQSYSIQPSVAGFIAGEDGVVLELGSKSGIYVSELANGNEEEVLLSHFKNYSVLELLRDVVITNEHGESVSVTLARLGE